jgi:hypothetical protein
MPGSGRPNGILTGLITAPNAPLLDAGVQRVGDYRALVRPIVHGQVNPPAVSVRVRYEDGAVQSVPVIDGYFLAVLERSHGSLIVEALDNSGRAVGAEPATLDTPKTEPAPPTETRPVITIPLPDGTATLLGPPSANPGRCYRVVAAANDGSRSGSGSCPGLVGELSYGFQQVGNAPNATILLFGAASSTIIKVRVKVGKDWLPLPLKEHYFLVELRPDQRPSTIETTSRSGVIKDREIHLDG